MKHRLTHEAKIDLFDAADQYDAVAGCGDDFADEVDKITSIIEVNPQGFSLASGAPRGREIRVVKIGRFDYLLYHEVLATEVVTIAIQHARRKSSAWRKRTP